MTDRSTAAQVDTAPRPTCSSSTSSPVLQGPQLLSPTLLFLLLVPQSAMAQSLESFLRPGVVAWAEYFGVLAIGWGVGVTGWLTTGHQAVSCLFVDMPRAWKLWQKKVLTSSLPVFKYLAGGGLLLLLGTLLFDQLWGLWTRAFDVGIMTGLVVGVGHSFANAREFGGQIDFLEANERFLNKNKVSLFPD